MMKLTGIAATLLMALGFTTNVYADLLSKPTGSNPIMDGVVSPGEWNAAGSLADGFGLAGTTYAAWSDGLTYDSGSYTGRFSFLLHNIEQNKTFANGVSGTDPAYNVFDIYKPDDSINKFLEVTVRYDGFSVNKYDSVGNLVDSRTFDSAVDLAPEQTGTYDWNYYFGIYAKGGYGNSAFTSGLTGAVDDSNQLFEVAYLHPGSGGSPVRRSLKDPDQLSNWNLVLYLDTTVTPVPEPTSFALLGIGLAAFGLLTIKRKDGPTRP